MRWRHHSEEQRTWEPLLQLTEDVPVLVAKYVADVGNPTLTQAHADCLSIIAADPDPDTVPAASTTATAAQRAASRTHYYRYRQDQTTTVEPPTAPTVNNETIDASRTTPSRR